MDWENERKGEESKTEKRGRLNKSPKKIKMNIKNMQVEMEKTSYIWVNNQGLPTITFGRFSHKKRWKNQYCTIIQCQTTLMIQLVINLMKDKHRSKELNLESIGMYVDKARDVYGTIVRIYWI